jgi:TRAP-type C4-dicarboxylate transport system substrate-binding protein
MRRTTLATLAAAALLGGPVPAQVFKLGTLAPENSTWHEELRNLGDEWKKLSGGKVDLKLFPGGILGDEPDMIRKLRLGQLQAAALTGDGLSDIAPDVMALQLPMLLRTDEELIYVRDRMKAKLEAQIDEKGFVVLIWGDAGWVQFFSQKPVVRMEDLKSQKLWTRTGDTTYFEVWKNAGFAPVALPTTEILTGLKSGLITSFATTPLIALSFQWFGLAKNLTDLNWAPLMGAILVVKKKWMELPADLREKLEASARQSGERLQREIKKLSADAVEVMKKRGLQVHQVPPDAEAAWEKAARDAYPKLVGPIVPKEAAAEVERLRNEYRASRKVEKPAGGG